MIYPSSHSSKNGALMETEQKVLGTGWIRVRERVKDQAQVVSLIHSGGKVNRNGQVNRKGWFGQPMRNSVLDSMSLCYC